MSALTLTQQDDDLWELSYLGSIVGWIQRVQPEGRRVTLYQAETPRGQIRHCYTLSQARNTLLELYA